MPTEAERADLISRAFEALTPKPSLSPEHVAYRISAVSSMLAAMGGPKDETVPPSFRQSNEAVADKYRRKLAKSTLDLSVELRSMTAPVIKALADVGIFKGDLLKLSEQLKDISDRAKSAKLAKREIQSKGGAPRKPRIQAIRKTVGDFYFDFTGKPPSGGGHFLRLSAEIIEALELDAKPGGFARMAANEFNARMRPGRKLEIT